ncbi:MAG: tetratricopeptide repeat protein, partial [Myxococcota bacterium]
MDQLSAHLERGWDLVARGNTQGAALSAERALELDPESAEVHNLVGYVAALNGESEEALDAYQQAIELDETYVEAMLNAAELLVHPIGDFDEALRMCDTILDITDYTDEVVDALLLKFEALVARGQREEGLKLLRNLPEGPYENPAQSYLAARAFFEAGDVERASKLLESALAVDPQHPEANYYAGLVAEDRGDNHAAVAAFLRTRQLELEAGVPPWSPNAETFLLFTRKALETIANDPELAPLIQSAEIYIADVPGAEVVVEGLDPRSLVL